MKQRTAGVLEHTLSEKLQEQVLKISKYWTIKQNWKQGRLKEVRETKTANPG
jgi:hypothetical protein